MSLIFSDTSNYCMGDAELVAEEFAGLARPWAPSAAPHPPQSWRAGPTESRSAPDIACADAEQWWGRLIMVPQEQVLER